MISKRGEVIIREAMPFIRRLSTTTINTALHSSNKSGFRPFTKEPYFRMALRIELERRMG